MPAMPRRPSGRIFSNRAVYERFGLGVRVRDVEGFSFVLELYLQALLKYRSVLHPHRT